MQTDASNGSHRQADEIHSLQIRQEQGVSYPGAKIEVQGRGRARGLLLEGDEFNSRKVDVVSFTQYFRGEPAGQQVISVSPGSRTAPASALILPFSKSSLDRCAKPLDLFPTRCSQDHRQ